MTTAEELLKIISGGEALGVEFKSEEHSRLNDRHLVETVVCLANRGEPERALLLIGVEDDGRISGARPRHGDSTDLDRLNALVAARTRPPLSVSSELVLLDGGPVLVIEVPRPSSIVGTSDGLFVRRVIGGDGKPACIPMDDVSMRSLQASRGEHDATGRVVLRAEWDDLDPLEFERYRRTVRERRGRSDEALLDLSDREIAQALGIAEFSGPTSTIRLAALLLFGKEEALRRFVPSHEVAFQVMKGLDVEVNDFFRWPLLRTMEEIEARIRARNREQELMVGLLRVGVPDYPERGLREALANALIHRDYLRIGAVHFQWHDDRIEISSPGGFPNGVHLGNLLVTAPRPRNPILADALKRAGIVERTARGIDTIFAEQLRNGRPAPSYDRSDDSVVVVVLPGGAANLEFVKLLVSEAQDGRVLSLDEMLVLNAIWQDRRIATSDASRIIQKPETEALSRLHRLVEAGLVEERGARKNRTWHFSAAVYRALGDKAGYVRRRGFEPLQQEQMVIQYIVTHGRITRNETAELCRVSLPQAYRILKRMVNKGVIEHDVEKGRSAGYTLRQRNAT